MESAETENGGLFIVGCFGLFNGYQQIYNNRNNNTH